MSADRSTDADRRADNALSQIEPAVPR